MHDLFSNTTIHIPTMLGKREKETLERENLERIFGEGKVDMGR